MEKIIVLAGESKNDKTLVNCLKSLFPECEIEVQVKSSKEYTAPGDTQRFSSKGRKTDINLN